MGGVPTGRRPAAGRPARAEHAAALGRLYYVVASTKKTTPVAEGSITPQRPSGSNTTALQLQVDIGLRDCYLGHCILGVVVTGTAVSRPSVLVCVRLAVPRAHAPALS